MRLALLTRLWTHLPGLVDESQRALDVYDGGDLVDVGAFHGWYSVLLTPYAAPGARLLSCEPDARAVPMLRDVLHDLNALFPSIETPILERPVGNGGPVATSWPAGEHGHPSFSVAGETNGETSVTVDEIVRTQQLSPRLIKVDVEGAEPFVLDGMQRTLREHRPAVILEIHTEWLPEGVSVHDVEQLLRGPGYQLTSADGDQVVRQVWTARDAAGKPSR